MRVEDAFVGHIRGGHRLYLSMRLTQEQEPHRRITVDHEPVTGPVLRFSASGTIVRKGGRLDRDGDLLGGGQCLDRLLLVASAAPPLTIKDIRALHHLWQRWHLNDLQAACSHMTQAIARLGKSETGYEARKHITCPATGYRYGTSWLVEPIPPEARAAIEGYVVALTTMKEGDSR